MGLLNFGEFLNESNNEDFERSLDFIPKDKPSIFQRTIYRLPTQDELKEFENFNLTGAEVFAGFGYTIIGRGIQSFENKKMIIDSIKSLCEMYPENKEYKAALTQATYENKNQVI